MQRDTDFAVTTILDAMNNAMVRGHRIEVTGFGSFSVMRRAPRVGCNPCGGEPVDISEKRVPHRGAARAMTRRFVAETCATIYLWQYKNCLRRSNCGISKCSLYSVSL